MPTFKSMRTSFVTLAIADLCLVRPMIVTRLQTRLILFSLLLICSHPVCGEQQEKGSKQAIEALSPDGKFAFRYTKDSKSNPDSDSESDLGKQTYDLIDKKSGKVVTSVAESDPDLGPSARFNMTVLWRPDSKAFALTALLWKRGTSLSVFRQAGSTFREIKVPELVAEVPEKVKRGKDFSHVAGLDSQKATQWQKDGSLVVEIETMVDGEGGSITATRTVVLGFDRSEKARILKSTIKYETEEPEGEELSPSATFLEADRHLNEVYNALRTRLSPTERDNLKKEQLGWINRRDAAVQAAKENAQENPTDAADREVTKMTQARAAELEKRLKKEK